MLPLFLSLQAPHLPKKIRKREAEVQMRQGVGMLFHFHQNGAKLIKGGLFKSQLLQFHNVKHIEHHPVNLGVPGLVEVTLKSTPPPS